MNKTVEFLIYFRPQGSVGKLGGQSFFHLTLSNMYSGMTAVEMTCFYQPLVGEVTLLATVYFT